MTQQTNPQPLPELTEAVALDADGKLRSLGESIGQLYTDHGLPIDMSLDRLTNLNKLSKLAVLVGAQHWLIEHRRNSGAPEKALDRMRSTNRTVLERFIKTGETGVY